MQKNVFANIKILDLSTYILGGLTTQVFADMGAEVIKIENPKTGDPGRLMTPKINNVSYYHTALDRNKKSITLNLKSEAGKKVYARLLKDADVVLENYRPGVMKRLGIDYEFERKIKPDIIHCAISSFGQDDPRSLLAYHDMNFHAMSGYMYLNGPRRSPIHWCDTAGAMVAVQSIMAALIQRGSTGEGAFCDVKMFDSFVWWNEKIDSRCHFNGGKLEADDLFFQGLGYNVYETKDGRYVCLGIVEQKFWNTFCTSQGLEDLLPCMFAREGSDPEAYERLRNHFKAKTLDEWKREFEGQDICVSYVLTKPEAIAYITKESPNLMGYCDFPLTGKTLQTRIPHSVSSIPIKALDEATPPPVLGGDNLEILMKAGFSKDEISAMAAAGDCGPIAE